MVVAMVASTRYLPQSCNHAVGSHDDGAARLVALVQLVARLLPTVGWSSLDNWAVTQH